MFIFGHTGITLGAAVLLSGTLIKSHIHPKTTRLEGQLASLQGFPSSQNGYFGGITSWLSSLASRIDIRILLIGSLLPDIIDKPIGRIFFRESFNSGRIFCHTLLFLIVLIVGGLYMYWRHKKTWLLVLSFGTLTHLILDQMWLNPRTLFWPLYGASFDRSIIDLSYWLNRMVHILFTNPVLAIPELAGAVVVLWFLLLLVRRRKLLTFIRDGRV